MSYTPVEIEVVASPVLALFVSDRSPYAYEACPVYAFAIFRDLDDKGADNYVVPLIAESFTRYQEASAADSLELEERLPDRIISHQAWWDAGQLSGSVLLVRTETGELVEA